MKLFRFGSMLIALPLLFVGCYGKSEEPAVDNPNIPAGSRKMDDSGDAPGGGVVPAKPEDG